MSRKNAALWSLALAVVLFWSLKPAAPTAVATTTLAAGTKSVDVFAEPLSKSHAAPKQHAVFEEFSRSVLANLPTVEAMRAEGGSYQFTPKSTLAASASLGQIAESLARHPEWITIGMGFYDECARRSDVVQAVRAVCLHHLKHWARKQPEVTTLHPSDYPEEVWHLSDSLPPVRTR